MKSWLLTAFLLILNTSFAMAASPYVGKWQLSEIIDAESNSKPLPEGETFEADIVDIDEKTLRMALKLGNSMSSKFTLEGDEGTPESQEIKMGMVLSTMMMPPPEVFAVENFWSKLAPTVTKVELDGDKLTFVGEGKIVLTKSSRQNLRKK